MFCIYTFPIALAPNGILFWLLYMKRYADVICYSIYTYSIDAICCSIYTYSIDAICYSIYTYSIAIVSFVQEEVKIDQLFFSFRQL